MHPPRSLPGLADSPLTAAAFAPNREKLPLFLPDRKRRGRDRGEKVKTW
jgi:hypothetical protein